jgi:hypothetical protein
MIEPQVIRGQAGPPNPGGALATAGWPAIMLPAGVPSQKRFLEFFAATIRNKNTIAAYFRVVCRFLKWGDGWNLDLEDIRPRSALSSAAAAKKLIGSIDISTVVGLRDRALVALMLSSFPACRPWWGCGWPMCAQGRRT